MNIIFKFNLVETQTPAPVQPQPQPDDQAELRVVVNPDVIQVQRGQTVDLTCVVYGGDQNTNIYWIQEEPERVKYFKIFTNIKSFLKKYIFSVML